LYFFAEFAVDYSISSFARVDLCLIALLFKDSGVIDTTFRLEIAMMIIVNSDCISKFQSNLLEANFKTIIETRMKEQFTHNQSPGSHHTFECR
jgi:hypothetical protein